MSILFDWYKNPNSNPDDGEEETAIHPRIHYNGATDTNELRRQIQRYCTVSETDVSAVLDALSHCMGKELAEEEKYILKVSDTSPLRLRAQNVSQPLPNTKLPRLD